MPNSQTIVLQRATPPLLVHLPIRTPERPRPRRSPSPGASEAALLSSTVPPRLGDDADKGKRKHSTMAKHRAAVRAGAIKGTVEEP